MMKFLCAFLFIVGLAIANGTLCKNLTGTWRNELGSNMTIHYIYGDATKITGQYNTSVESSKGAAKISSPISGLVQHVDNGSLVAWNVLYNRGASLAAWVGQCIVCNGEERIFTTWVLQSLMPPISKWMTTTINQNTFWRIDHDDPQNTEENPVSGNAVLNGLVGSWTAENRDTIDITVASEVLGYLEGQHMPPEQTGPSALINGRFDGNNTYTALGFVSATSTHIRGWTGHIYDPSEPINIMETSWLSHAFSDRCHNPRKFVQYGMNNYTNIPDADINT